MLLSNLRGLRYDTVTELCAKVLLSFLNCSAVLLQDKISGELQIEITSKPWHTLQEADIWRKRTVGWTQSLQLPYSWFLFYSDFPIAFNNLTKPNFFNISPHFLCSGAKKVITRTLGRLHLCWNSSPYNLTSHSHIFCTTRSGYCPRWL